MASSKQYTPEEKERNHRLLALVLALILLPVGILMVSNADDLIGVLLGLFLIGLAIGLFAEAAGIINTATVPPSDDLFPVDAVDPEADPAQPDAPTPTITPPHLDPKPLTTRVPKIVTIIATLALGYMMFYEGSSLPSEPHTVTSGGVTVTVSGGWQTETNPKCDDPLVDCLLAAAPSRNLQFELVRFELGSLTIDEFDELLWAAFTVEHSQAELISHEAVRVDGHSAIQRVFVDDNVSYLTLVIEEDGSMLRLWAEGSSTDFEKYRDDLNTSIDSLRFASTGNE